MKDCKVWSGYKTPKGYGQKKIGGKRFYVHRLEFEKHNGPIPEGRLVCHHCDNPSCYEITHLFCGTAMDNSIDMRQKGRHRYAKLTNEIVLDVVRRLDGGTPQGVVARAVGVKPCTISKINTGGSWAWLTGRG